MAILGTLDLLFTDTGVQSRQSAEAAGGVLGVAPAGHDLRHHQPNHVRTPQLLLPAGQPREFMMGEGNGVASVIMFTLKNGLAPMLT